MSLQHARIAARAHDLWELRGRPDGSSEIDWYQAEKQLIGDANDPSEPKTTLDPLARQAADVLIDRRRCRETLWPVPTTDARVLENDVARRAAFKALSRSVETRRGNTARTALLANRTATRERSGGMAEREGFEPSKGFWPLHP